VRVAVAERFVTETPDSTAYRPLLFAIAYRMLGSAADAEDMVQETYLRWQSVTPADMRSPKAWLSTVVTRLCIDYLRSARVRREQYVGTWLPEPVVTDVIPDVADTVALNESLSMAFLLLLERLSPVERAAFLLHDIFAYEYAEIAPIVGKSEGYCRQLARRARLHIAAQRPRFDPPSERREQLVRQFLHACDAGDLSALIATLAEDVTVWGDGGGKALAIRQPVHGAASAARLLLGILGKVPSGFVVRRVDINGQPGVIGEVTGVPIAAATLEILDQRVQAIRIVVNPDKLQGLGQQP
jgi:RNA polymerase sigma-70 factor (ECF subfamily)